MVLPLKGLGLELVVYCLLYGNAKTWIKIISNCTENSVAILYPRLYPLLWVEILFGLAPIPPGALLLPTGYGDRQELAPASQFAGNTGHIFPCRVLGGNCRPEKSGQAQG